MMDEYEEELCELCNDDLAVNDALIDGEQMAVCAFCQFYYEEFEEAVEE